MSDPNNPGEGAQPPSNPYGQPPSPPLSPSGPSGAPEYTAPQQNGPQYGQPAAQQYGQSPYGQTQPYGQSPYGGPQPYGAADPQKRPGTVTAASIVTMIITGLGLIGFAIGAVLVLATGDQITDELRDDPDFQELGISGNDLASFLAVFFVIIAVWCLAAFVLSIVAMRGQNWARILVVISAGISGVFSLLAIFSGVSAITLIAAVAVGVLYFTGGANDWYRAKAAARRQ